MNKGLRLYLSSIFCLFCLLLPIQVMSAIDSQNPKGKKTATNPPTKENRINTEIRISDVYFLSETMRDIFDSGAINYQVTQTYSLKRGINLWWALDFFQKEGHSIGNHQKTVLRVIPLTFGLKYISPDLKGFRPYAGAGFKYSFVRVRNYSPDVSPTIYDNGPGFVTEAGSLYFLNKYIFLDAFISYTYCKINATKSPFPNVQKSSLDLQAFNFGAGIGASFTY